ncbi:hypothetical protein ALP75_204548 [Pseudomonas syringae pv. actinidiae]|nr:hypothetical protein ALP75_204548 [Pseudomonas syringae pv. actinidiae]
MPRIGMNSWANASSLRDFSAEKIGDTMGDIKL